MKATELKKGMQVVEFGPYNFIGEAWKDRKNDKIDEYFFHQWTIHSVGKVLLRLQDEEGLKETAIRSYNGEFSQIALSIENVKNIINERREKHGYEPESYIITNRRLNF